ncbi:MAG: type VI secretion system baseplate subunit TssF [Polaromonas sp.]|uniref:type VI secretion system baseplate subunit TssF n=1 Tax=Polaromonas sp. TaxID=1869339 RepID=UPI0018151F7B|nr:type VI secretion system baseplate subunit TssF [Polaromonas sp.]NMM10516.1 type VI secretion system baseplate subunit TssF [Polaromonas sp.]
MNNLLPFYERELGFLRRYSREFSEKYPKIAGDLLMAGEVCEDPHIERMIQSFALMSARISKRLEDDFPEFTEALLEVLYPHYLKPFPACSIARFDYSASAGQLTGEQMIPRGTELVSRSVKGIACKFRTTYDVTITPIKIDEVKFEAIFEAPESVILPTGSSSKVSIRLSATSEQALIGEKTGNLRIFVDGEPSFCAALLDSVFLRTVAVYVQAENAHQWLRLPKVPVKPVGFSEQDSLIDFPQRSHPAYRLLTEYFSFPEKFSFFDLDLGAVFQQLKLESKAVVLHFVFAGVRADSNAARMLGSLSKNNLLLGCTPVVNLFKQRGEPIRVTHAAAQYPVVANARNAYAYEVYSVDAVKLVKQTAQGEFITEVRPLYSLKHGSSSEKDGRYWSLRRDELIGLKSPGYETEITIVDVDFNPAKPETDTLSIDLTCTNRDMPSLLSYGLSGGDLFLEGGSLVKQINFLRKPTVSHRFERGRGAHWRLISHLSLNHLSLSQKGIEAFQETLRLYDLPRSVINEKILAGVVAIDHQPTSRWLSGKPFSCLARGIEITLTIDEDNFVGSGLHVFANILDRFFALYVHVNSFTQISLKSKKSGEILLKCQPRSGDSNLV